MNLETVEKTNEESKPKIVALAMSERLRQMVREEAYEKEFSFSATIRYILEKYFSEKSRDSDADC